MLHEVTVLLEYFNDCSIRVSRSGITIVIVYSWVHESCEGVSNDNKKLQSVSMPNIIYCCNLNQCVMPAHLCLPANLSAGK